MDDGYRTVSVLMKNSVVDLNTLNLDPDPEFWSNFYLDQVLYYQFLKKKISFNKI